MHDRSRCAVADMSLKCQEFICIFSLNAIQFLVCSIFHRGQHQLFTRYSFRQGRQGGLSSATRDFTYEHQYYFSFLLTYMTRFYSRLWRHTKNGRRLQLKVLQSCWRHVSSPEHPWEVLVLHSLSLKAKRVNVVLSCAVNRYFRENLSQEAGPPKHDSARSRG